MGADHADTGRALPGELTADAKTRYYKFTAASRQISLRNTGVNTLWFSFDKVTWFDVACGTSWDDRVSERGLWFHTQVGMTTFVINVVALNLPNSAPPPEPEPEELE